MSIESVCSSLGNAADGAWETVKSGAGKVGDFCGRAATSVKGFWNDSVFPFIQRIIDAVKDSFSKAKEWAESNPDTVRAVVITAAVAIATAAVFMRFCRNNDSSAKKEDVTPKEEAKKA